MNKQRKKLTLNKETLRDLMAQNAGELKGGAKTNGKKCATPGPGPSNGRGATACGFTCPTLGCTMVITCPWTCYPCH